MMGFNPPVPQQDSNWEIRVVLLLSLLLQVLLIFLGPMRKRSASRVSSFIIWSCYLLSDWVADLALGLLLNNTGNIGGGRGNSTSSFGLRRGGGATTTGNNSSSNDNGSGSPTIFAFWTPFLLLHLGGPDTITAYSVEDNELWRRHLIGLLFELFSALVIFFCSLRSNPSIRATMLMFVVGIIKYAERTYSLYCGSVNGFRKKIMEPAEPGLNYAKLMTEFDSKKKAGLVVDIEITNREEAKEAHEEKEKQEMTTRLVQNINKSVEAQAYEFFLIFRRLFVNLSLSFKERRLSQAFFLERKKLKASEAFFLQRKDMTPREAFEVIEVELNFIYDMVYTKAPVAYRRSGWICRCICSCCLVSALVIFFFLDKPGHQIQRVDVGITYALLFGGLALDVTALLMIFFSNRAKVYLEGPQRLQLLRWLAGLRQVTKWWQTQRWSGEMSQLNLITDSMDEPAHSLFYLRLNKVTDFLGIVDVIDEFVFIRRVRLNKRDKNKFCRCLRRIGRCVLEKLIKPLAPKCCDKAGVHEEDDKTEESRLLDFIFHGLKGSAQKLHDKNAIMEVCSRRGKGVIDRREKEIKEKLTGFDDADKEAKFDLILDSVASKDFDESLLLWHIATDLCRHKDKPGASTKDTPRFRAISKTLSEYMLYLLIKQPDMLHTTAGIGLLRYQDTRAEAKRFFDSMAAWIPEYDHDDARMMLLSVNTTRKPSEVKGDRSKSALFDGVILAKVLRELDEALMWDVITGVWGEMLMYAAGKCRGSMHVRQLSRGGELVNLVWFLMVHMGLGDMYQIQERDSTAKLIIKDQ